MPRLVDLGVTRWDWVPGDSPFADPSHPTVAEMSQSGAVNLSPYVVTTSTMNATASDTVNERSIAETANVVVPTVANYEGTLTLFRDYDAGVPTENDPFDLFTEAGIFGWLVRRLGKPSDAVHAADDRVDVFKVMTDNPQASGGAGDGYLKVTVPMLQQGFMRLNTTIGAGA